MIATAWPMLSAPFMERTIVALVFSVMLGASALLCASTVSLYVAEQLRTSAELEPPVEPPSPAPDAFAPPSYAGWRVPVVDRPRCEAEPPASARPRLVATIIADDARSSRAVLVIEGAVRILALGDAWDDAVLNQLERGEAILRTRCADLALPLSISGEASPSKPRESSAPFRLNVAETMASFESLSRQARIIPHFSGGSIAGFKILAIQPGSLYARAGLENGDIVETVNGERIDQLSRMGAIEELRQKGTVHVELKRRGAPISIPVHLD